MAWDTELLNKKIVADATPGTPTKPLLQKQMGDKGVPESTQRSGRITPNIGYDVIVQDEDTLSQGDRDAGPDGSIRNVQGKLNALGIDVGDVDGVIGGKTSRGVQEAQGKLGLPRTGLLDRKTQLALTTLSPSQIEFFKNNPPSMAGYQNLGENVPVTAETAKRQENITQLQNENQAATTAEAVTEVETPVVETPVTDETEEGRMGRPLTSEERTALSDVGGLAAKKYLEDKGLDQNLFDSFEATSTYAKQQGWTSTRTPHVPMFTSSEKRKAMTVLNSVAESVYEGQPELVAALKTIMDHESGGKLAELGYGNLRGSALAAQIHATKDSSRLRALIAMENSAEYRNGDREKKDMMIFDVYYADEHRKKGFKMGNTKKGDGSKYRGRGIIQLTGKNNYKKYGDMIGVDLVNNPDYMQNRPDVMIAASLAYLEDKGLNEGTLSARKMARVIGHADDTGRPEARARWRDVISSIEAAGNQDLAEDMRLNDEYLAQETVGVTVDGIISSNNGRVMKEWLGRAPRKITVPQGTSTLDLVRMVNTAANP